MNKYIMELIGTFFLVLTIGCTVIGNGAGALAPLAIGAALMVMTHPPTKSKTDHGRFPGATRSKEES